MTSMLRAGLAALALTVSLAFSGADPAAAAQNGLASYYKSGAVTANGEPFDPYGLTAAHRTLPFGTKVRVTNLESGASVIVRINDRGPFVGKRVIDLSLGAARMIGMVRAGVVPVRVDRL